MSFRMFNLKLNGKFISFFLLFAIVPSVLISAVVIVLNNDALMVAENDVESLTKQKLESIGFELAISLNTLMDQIYADARRLQSDPQLKSSLDLLTDNDPSDDATVIAELDALFKSYRDALANNQMYQDIFLLNSTTGVVLAFDGATTGLRGIDLSDRDLYTEALKQVNAQGDGIYFKDIYYDEVPNKYVLVVSTPVRTQATDQVKGIIAFGIDSSVIHDLLAPRTSGGNEVTEFYEKTGLGTTGEVYIVDSNGLAASRSRFETDDQNHILETSYAANKGVQNAHQNGVFSGLTTDYRGVDVYGFYLYLGSSDAVSNDERSSWLKGKLTNDLPWVLVAEMDEEEVLEGVNQIEGIQATTIGGIFLILVLTAVVTGVLAFAIARSISRPINELANHSVQLAQGDLLIEVEEVQSGDELETLTKSFQAMVDFLKPTVNEIAHVAETLASSSQEMASSAEEVNASSEEISSISQQMSRGAQEQTKQISDTLDQSEGLRLVFQTKIKEVRAASELIESITSQVNMLALNASIEAARAGEYGRGFAVVADNIRQLADDSKAGLGRINSVVNDIEQSLTGSINQIKESIERVSAVAEETASGAEEASAATEEQAATMEELSASAQELSQLAANLEDVVRKFKT